MPRFTTASATRSSSARSSVVNTSAVELVEKAWESSARTLSHFSATDTLENEVITVWKGSQNLLSSGIIWRGLRRVNEEQRDERDRGGFEVRGSRFLELRTPNLELRTSLRAFLFEDFPLRLKPVIKGALADALFVDLAGSRRDPRVEIFRYGR